MIVLLLKKIKQFASKRLCWQALSKEIVLAMELKNNLKGGEKRNRKKLTNIMINRFFGMKNKTKKWIGNIFITIYVLYVAFLVYPLNAFGLAYPANLLLSGLIVGFGLWLIWGR